MLQKYRTKKDKLAECEKQKDQTHGDIKGIENKLEGMGERIDKMANDLKLSKPPQEKKDKLAQWQKLT